MGIQKHLLFWIIQSVQIHKGINLSFDWTAFFDESFTISRGFKGVLKLRLCVSAIYEGDAIDPALMRELPEEDITKMSYQPYINGSKQKKKYCEPLPGGWVVFMIIYELWFQA